MLTAKLVIFQGKFLVKKNRVNEQEFWTTDRDGRHVYSDASHISRVDASILNVEKQIKMVIYLGEGGVTNLGHNLKFISSVF